MDVLVKFIAAENTIEITDNISYIQNVYRKIMASGLIKNLIMTPDEVELGVGPIRELDEEGNIFLLRFTSEENQRTDNWEIYFQYGTYNTAQQLEIAIYSDTYVVNKNRNYLEKLKLKIKSIIIAEWKKILWLVDRDSECLSVELYPKIYKTENLMREVINEVMTKQYGTSWWDTFAPADMKKKHGARIKEYKLKVPAFNNVDERLMSIDIDDLGKLIVMQRYKWEPQFDDKISGYLNGVQEYNDKSIKELLLEQRKLEIDLWRDQFSKYLPADFNKRYSMFTKDRNHIMHNKLIDRAALNDMLESIELIENDLLDAIEKLHKLILSDEEKFEIEKQKKIEAMMQEELDHECRENDANVSIRDSNEIVELFHDSLAEFITAIEENLRFRNDLDVYSYAYSGVGICGSLISISSKIDGTCMDFTYDMIIDDSEGADSQLCIHCSDFDFETYVRYINGEVEYDDEIGLYMLITEDEIEIIDYAVEETMRIINVTLCNYNEIVETDDVVDYVTCSECGEEYICINDNILPIGTCLSCGYVNEIYECDRCGDWFNINENGTYEQGEYGEFVGICQICIDELDEE